VIPVAAALLLAAAVGAAPRASAETYFDARVVAVLDGDTIEVLVGREPRRIRLAGIDTPERGQPWAERSKQALSDRVFRKEVRINAVATDRYGRTVGEVYADDVCVGCELVRAGHAWVYRRFSEDPVLLALEAEARAARRGLWSLPESERVPPWEWRRRPPRAPRAPGSRGRRIPALIRRGGPPPARPRSGRQRSGCARAGGAGGGR
jgi:endonuclease YncB( thermonuclease family)